MAVINRIAEFHDDMTAWRRDIHAHPETAFEEIRTADTVAALLEGFGMEVHRGLATTGVVGTLKAGSGSRSIGLRADMDALHLHEKNSFDHRSVNDGKMHACGHDGHTTMLLGAARYLAETRNFDGTIHFIFQPAEENEGGGRVMVEEGLFEQFPCDAVYGMHNASGIEVGRFAVREGPFLAAFDIFEITVTGVGTHAAMPDRGIDPMIPAAQIVTALQTIPSRRVSPLSSAVVSVTQIHGGDTWNVIPDQVVLRGTCRWFDRTVRDLLEPAMRQIADGIAAAHRCSASLRYERRYPATVNAPAETAFAAGVAEALVGPEHVDRNFEPDMGSEDFAFMLEQKPGCYILIGNGPEEGGCLLHNPHYDFNDAVLPLGASYWARLAEAALARG
ncbi:MAG: M20 family metallopeptidase [Proteobacteria bacterium]|nr:M20 family metallopeptidase [Pseudomonadota bacterium]